jgi:hypothetical protein
MQFWCVTAQPVLQHPGVAHSQPSSAVGAAGFEQLENPALQVGEHVPAFEQLVVDAFAVEHARPHAPQSVVVVVEPHPASTPLELPELLPLLDPLLLPELLALPELLPELLAEPLLEPLPLLDPDEDPLLDALPELEPPELVDPPELEVVPESLPPEPLPLPLPELLPLLDPLLPPPLLLAPELLPCPPEHTGTVVDVPVGAIGWHDCPEEHPCDESQKGTHMPPMQMSFAPHEVTPTVSSQLAPAPPEPAWMQPYASGPTSAHVWPPPHSNGSSLQSFDEHAEPTATPTIATTETKSAPARDFMPAASTPGHAPRTRRPRASCRAGRRRRRTSRHRPSSRSPRASCPRPSASRGRRRATT